jgi:phosphoglycerate dehydrogenase-like enzyme
LTITTMSGANAPPVAEHAIGLALSLSRKIPELVVHQGRAEWITKAPGGYQPKDLQGSTVGIVGYGSIGRQIARLLHNFGVTILAAKRNAMQPQDQGYSSEGTGDPEGNFFTRLYPVQALRSMLSECDLVFVTAPLTPETEGLIGSAELEALKPSCYLVDVSRGGVVDQQALVKALEEKTFAGAAIDVFPEEPLPENSPIWTLPNVLISPHVAGFSPNYDRRAMELFAENLRRYLNEEPLYNQLDLRRGY